MTDGNSDGDSDDGEDWSEGEKMDAKMTQKSLTRGFIGARHAPTEAITCAVAVHNRGDAADRLEEMAKNNKAGWEKKGGRGTYHIVDVEDAVSFVDGSPFEVPFNFQ